MCERFACDTPKHGGLSIAPPLRRAFFLISGYLDAEALYVALTHEFDKCAGIVAQGQVDLAVAKALDPSGGYLSTRFARRTEKSGVSDRLLRYARERRPSRCGIGSLFASKAFSFRLMLTERS